MRPDKAIVYVGITPPECEYFSYIEYIALRYSEELSTYHRIFTSLGDSISLSRLQSEPAYKTNVFSEPIIIIFTADKVADQNAREALMNAGYPEEIMHTLVIPKDLVCMGLVAESDTFSTLSRIALFKDQSEGENFINSTPGIVYRLTPTIEGEPDYYIPDSAIFLIDSMLKIYDNLQVEIKRIEERIKFYLKDKENELRILMSVPEIGIVIGSNLLAEIGDVHDFPTADKLAKWAGLTPSVYQSANTNYTGPITKQRSKYLRWALIEAAHSAIRRPGKLNDYFNGLLPRKGYKKAIVAVARKILRIVWHLLINNEIFEDGIPRVKTVKIPKFPEKIERVGIAKIIQLLSRGAEIIIQEEGKEIMRINGSSQPI